MDHTVDCQLKLSLSYITLLFAERLIKTGKSREGERHALIKKRHTMKFF